MSENENFDNSKHKICPECKNECSINDTFCFKCDYHFTTKKCPQCNYENDINKNFCTKCGYKFLKEENVHSSYLKQKSLNHKKNNNSLFLALFIIIILLILLIVSIVYIIAMDNIREPNKHLTPNCEAPEVKKLALNIFRENDKYYKSIEPGTISSLEFLYPAVNSYNEIIDKYECSAQIKMKSTYGGFLPLEYNTSNLYYKYINDSWLDTDLAQYTDYRIDVEYSTQISEGSTLVSLKQINNTFTCEGSCERLKNPEYDTEYIENEEQDYNSKNLNNETEPLQQTKDNPTSQIIKPKEKQLLPANSNVQPLKNKINSNIYKQEAENELF